MITREVSTKVVYFMTPWAGVPVLWHVHINRIVKIHCSFKVFFSTPGHRSDKLSIKL